MTYWLVTALTIHFYRFLWPRKAYIYAQTGGRLI
jgi:hypothetical protein